MKRILCIAYAFPPQGGGGVQRTVKFLKYLPNFGWQATVLTSPIPAQIQDQSLLQDIPPQTEVVRVRGLELPTRLPWRIRNWITNWLLVVDAQIGWWPFAVRRARAKLSMQKTDVLYSTSAPYTDHLVALHLKRHSGLPWIADFRDPWLENFRNEFATPLHRWLCGKLEERIVQTADRVLVVSEPMRQQFLHRYPQLKRTHFVTLTNGFDAADYVEATPIAREEGRFVLVYTGSLYGKQQSGRFILEAIKQLVEAGTLPRTQFSFWLVGAAGQEAIKLIQQWQLTDVVKLMGYLPHAEMIRCQLAADALLLIVGQGPGSEVVFTGKIFEYLATKKPILALAAPSAAVDLLRETGGANMVSPDDVPAIAAALLEMFTAWQKGTLTLAPDAALVSRYERGRLTQELATILDEACA